MKDITKHYYTKMNHKNENISLIGGNGVIDINKFYSWEEISKHNKSSDGWIVLTIDNISCVFDVTKWIPEHPGGPDVLIKHLGIDATSNFEAIGHPEFVYKKILPKYFKGYLKV